MYLNMSEEDKENFAVGRRLNYYFTLSDLNNVKKKKIVAEYISNIKEKNVDIDMVCNLLRSKVI